MTQNGLCTYTEFLSSHLAQLNMSGIPSHLWPKLHQKLVHAVFDAGEHFSLLQIEYDGERGEGDPLWQVVTTTDIAADDPDSVYLIDHAWTCRINEAAAQLQHIPGLLDRMVNLMDITSDGKTLEDLLQDVLETMWKFNNTYSLRSGQETTDDSLPVWYVMDEFGSRIQHSENPSFCTVPFYYLGEQISYSVLFPLHNVKEGDEVTRNYAVLPENSHEHLRKALLLPWVPSSFLDVDYYQEEPSEDFFQECRRNESLPRDVCSPVLPSQELVKVYSEYVVINNHLKHSRFVITSAPEDADILWYLSHFKDFSHFSEASPNKMINQFPYEHVITVKDLLSVVCRRKYSEHASKSDSLDLLPEWLPTTFNLKTELPQFVSYFQHREQLGLDNHWISKPWNLARGMDTHISNDLNMFVRLSQAGPKIVQKYLEKPVLFQRATSIKVKFDIRYIVMLKCVKPLDICVYKKFWLRFANKEFELNDFSDYERHFTVMNYNEAPLLQMFCDDFIREFEEQYPDFKWSSIEENIFHMLREVFESATMKEPPCGIGHNPQSRALYGVDLMLSWKNTNGETTIQPKLLEINWAPDCKRACDYYPTFFNDVFGALFLNEPCEYIQQL